MTTPVVMFMNMKGGVGKTALASDFAFSLSWYYDRHSLLIDFDPQANCSFGLLGASKYFDLLEEGKSISKVLMPELTPEDPFNILSLQRSSSVSLSDVTVRIRDYIFGANDMGCLDLIPSDLELMRLAVNIIDPPQEQLLLTRWNGLINEARASYDFVVVDCHPAGSFFTKAAILSSDAVVIPVTSDGYAETGLSLMRRFVESWSSSGGAQHYAIVFNDAQGAWDEPTENTIRSDDRYFDKCIPSHVPHSKLIHNVVQHHRFVREQKTSYKRIVGRQLAETWERLIEHFRDIGLIDSSWERKR